MQATCMMMKGMVTNFKIMANVTLKISGVLTKRNMTKKPDKR